MKKMLSIILIALMVISVVPCYAASDVTVYLNGTLLTFDVPAQIIDGRTMVPMRKIFESLGAVVSWDAPTRTATGTKDGTVVNVSIDSTTLFKNGVPKVLDVPPQLVDGRTLVPARAIAESFDCTVDWIPETRRVLIKTGQGGGSKTTLTASEISEKVAPSVFYIEVYNRQGDAIGSGSGFFVTSDGVAVTNYHVIADTASAFVTTIDGGLYSVKNVIAFDENLDLAIIKVDKSSVNEHPAFEFPVATIGNSDTIKAGQTVYALGSPMGLQNTISNGIISNVSQRIGDDTFIQITAPISHGSSGGALVNEYGEVLGVTSAGIDEAQNIGFAIPINAMKPFDLSSEGVTYLEFASMNKTFTLELSSDTLEIEVGETNGIYVYADSDVDDWSIYYAVKDNDIVSCEWGAWLEDNTSVCPLYIKGLKKGTTTVTVYSDVDFKGKDVIVTVKEPRVATYSGSVVPTYTAITGVQLKERKVHDTAIIYKYNYYDIDDVGNYEEYLLTHGFTYDGKVDRGNLITFYYIPPDNQTIGVSLAPQLQEVWITIPR